MHASLPVPHHDRRPVVGILGGMGPAATADFYAKLIAATPASRDQDHIPVVIWADPRVPDRTAALLGAGGDPVPALRGGVEGLVAAGATLLAVACNTAHAFVPDLARAAGIELVDMITITAAHLQARYGAGARVGLLATDGAIKAGLYRNACAAVGIDVVDPGQDDQRRVMGAIAAVKAGIQRRDGPRLRADLREVCSALHEAGALAVVAGCTEIVLALGGGCSPPGGDSTTEPDAPGEQPFPIPLIDPAVLLARDVVRRAWQPPPEGFPPTRSQSV